ncbi:MAG: aldo/keto reductase [Methanomicrobiales archaeon]|nr:aldo/keto reductase [Methanomicrobiales archaeon]
MLYRTMKKVGEKLSILGFGCMRLPQTPDCQIDEGKATEMVRYAISRGVNYFDTAYVYHNGESEPFLGRALSDGYRKKVHIATKMPVWAVERPEDMDRFLDEQLERLQTDYIDFYLLHGLMKKTWDQVIDLDVTGFLDRAISDGRIRYAGFSFHDNLRLFEEIVNSYNWTFCQVQYNYMDEEYQAGTEGLRYAHECGLGIIVMEPLRGGTLAKQTGAQKKIWAETGVTRTPADWGLRWVWDHPEVTVVLSGMSTLGQVKDNSGYANHGTASTLTPEDLGVYGKIERVYREKMKIPCTKCGYCIPCPGGIAIPDCFSMYNDAFIYDDVANAKQVYEAFTGFGGKASCCQDCGVCESFCPQHIPIRKCLKEVVRLFGT